MMLATTRVFCGEASQDTAYSLNLAQATSFVIRDGQLALALPMDAGIIFFDPIVESTGVRGNSNRERLRPLEKTTGQQICWPVVRFSGLRTRTQDPELR